MRGSFDVAITTAGYPLISIHPRVFREGADRYCLVLVIEAMYEAKHLNPYYGFILYTTGKNRQILIDLGEFPFGDADLKKPKRQKNRQLKAVCSCDRIIRGSKKEISKGTIQCMECESPFVC